MTLFEQAAVIVEAVEHGFWRADRIVRWADAEIIAARTPALWLIELSTADESDIATLMGMLRRKETDRLTLHRRIQIVALAWEAGLISLSASLPKLFAILMFEPKGATEDQLNERLHEALVDWDFHEDLDQIDPALLLTFEQLLRQYLLDAHETSELLQLKHENVS